MKTQLTLNLEKARETGELRSYKNAGREALAIVLFAVVVSSGSGLWHCLDFWECSGGSDPTCAKPTKLDNNLFYHCSFSNIVSFSGEAMYNYTDAKALQGVCKVGERHAADGSCSPHRSYPDALEYGIMEEGATDYHDQACGKWIKASGPDLLKPVYWSFYDTDVWAKDLLAASAAQFGQSSMSTSNVGKFYTECVNTVNSGTVSMHSSAFKAYQYLNTDMNVAGIDSVRSALVALGKLVGHSCDTSVRVGVTTYGSGYGTVVYDGTTFTTGSLADALFGILGEWDDELLASVEDANKHINDYAWNSPAASILERSQVLLGATDDQITENTTTAQYVMSTPYLDGFIHLAKTLDWAKVRAFLQASSAMCAFTIATSTTPFGATSARATEEQTWRFIADLKRARPSAAALGRLQPPDDEDFDGLLDINETAVLEASSITFSQLRVAPIGNAREDCLALTRAIFPDEMDSSYYNMVVTPLLSERLERLVATTRGAVETSVLTNARFAEVLKDPHKVASAVASAHVRIPGAPRGSWAGASRDMPTITFSSEDGVVLMALKQAKLLFLDRVVELAINNADICEGPPVYSSISANAYIYPSAKCSYILFGMLRRPWADERYDDVSLALRVGYVLAHELGHLSLLTNWYPGPKDLLLKRYSANVHTEAIADVIAVAALIENKTATRHQVCMHVSQLWCARMPPIWFPSDTASHPAPNFRGDALCNTMEELFAEVSV